jgi:hypothetical protein
VTKYDVYATRWDDPHVVDELIPARDLEFSMPLSDHGECSFTATVEPGWSSWRSSITKDMSGVLVARDGQPVWQGWVTDDDQSGPRSFTFRAYEWGHFFTRVPAVPKTYKAWNDAAMFRDLINSVQAQARYNPGIVTGSATGAATSDRTINAWDHAMVEAVFREISEAKGGPEWYFGTTGPLDNPGRQLYLADRLGTTDVAAFLEYVEDTAPATRPQDIPLVALLGDMFPGPGPIVPTRRAGGNVVALARHRAGDSSTVAVAVNDAPEGAQLSATAESSLLDRGWPGMVEVNSYSKVTNTTTLQRHADADLKASEGFATGYSLATLDGDPDWTQVPRGSTVRVSLDTDVYAGPRPLEFDTRVLGITVRVPDSGRAQVQWDVQTVQEF